MEMAKLRCITKMHGNYTRNHNCLVVHVLDVLGSIPLKFCDVVRSTERSLNVRLLGLDCHFCYQSHNVHLLFMDSPQNTDL